jgi:hypothetical protein
VTAAQAARTRRTATRLHFLFLPRWQNFRFAFRVTPERIFDCRSCGRDLNQASLSTAERVANLIRRLGKSGAAEEKDARRLDGLLGE